VNIRINNIGAMPIAYLGKAPKVSEHECSIIRYYPNEYYGKLEEFLADGWEDKGSCISSNSASIDKKCFEGKETHYVIAFLRHDKNTHTAVLKTVGDRLLDLNDKEEKDFFKVYRLATQNLLEGAILNGKTKDY
jgi:hypothetical protein